MNLLFFAPFYPSPNLSPLVRGEELLVYPSLRRGARSFRSHLGTGSTRQGVPVPTRFFHFNRTFALTDL